MRGGPMSNLRRPWRPAYVLLIVSPLALAAACGPPDAAGSRGSSGSAGSSGGVQPADGAGLTDGGALADGAAPFDGGACIDDGTEQTNPNMTAASGTFSGALAGAVCTGGAFAYVQSTPADDGGAPDVELLIATVGSGDPAARIRFQGPADVTDGELDVDIGIAAATPGTYTQDVTCGSIELVADLPGPDPSICATDADSFDCPDGCQSTGQNQPCTPIPPQVTYAALAASDCRGDSATAVGSWTVTLSSLTAEPDAGTGTLGSVIYKVHGTLTVTLADQDPDAGTEGVTLDLSF